MQFLPHITLFAAIFFSKSEALSKSNWFGPSQSSPVNIDSNDASKGCDKGACVRPWKCPEDYVIFENLKACVTNGDTNWVCCVYPSASDENFLTTNLYATRKPIRLTSISKEESQHELSRDDITHDEFRESSNIKFPNDRAGYLDIRSEKNSEYVDSRTNSWEKVTKPSQEFESHEDYWDGDVIIDDDSRESSNIKFPNGRVDYSNIRSDKISEYADYYSDPWEKDTKPPQHFERREDYWDKRVSNPTPEPTKPIISSGFNDRFNPSPAQRKNFTEKLRPKQTTTSTRLIKATRTPPNERNTKQWYSDKWSEKTTPIPLMRTTVPNYDNYFTDKIWKNTWKQSISVHLAKTTANPQKHKATTSRTAKKTTAVRKNTSATRQWYTTVPTKHSTVTKHLGNFWNRRTTSIPFHEKSTTISGNNFSSKKWDNNWNKQSSTSSTWKRTTKNEFQDDRISSRKANGTNEITSSSTRKPTLTSTKTWNSSNRRTTTQQYTFKTKRPFIVNEPTYTNAWLWPESEENKNYDGDRQSSRRSTSTQASSVRNIGNVRFASSSTTRNRITTPMPDVQNQICGCRNRNEINILNQRNTSNGRRNTGPWNRHQQPFQRIVGGQEAEPFSWPWVAALYKVTSPGGGNRFLSAGTLINKYYVLTAAHVFNSDDLRTTSYVVLLGTHNVTISISEYMVSSILLHPQYEKRYYYNDIALLRLEQPVQFNDYVMPVCLPTRNSAFLKDSNLEGRRVTVMGWGDDEFGGRSSPVLREASFPIVSRKLCNASYVRVALNRFPRGITEEMLCAGSPKGGMDACQGDSGGPLLALENGRYTQVGIVSFGYKCGDKDFPGVYTKVSYYIGWITENAQQRRS